MKTNDIYFIRYGNLNSVKHKEARKVTEDSWIHIAPCYKGIYAFPRGYVELYLIGGSYTRHSKRYLKINNERITEEDFFDEDFEIKKEYLPILKKHKIHKRNIESVYDEDDDKWYITYVLKPKHFKYNGDIWHHLGEYVNKKDIIAEKNGWYKTSFSTYVKALHKCDTHERFYSYMLNKNRHGNPHTHPNKCIKDLYEVFIEHVK